MSTIALRQRIKADATHTIHLTLPPEMGNEVEIIILAANTETSDNMPSDSACAFNGSRFVQSLLNHPDEDCWNDL